MRIGGNQWDYRHSKIGHELMIIETVNEYMGDNIILYTVCLLEILHNKKFKKIIAPVFIYEGL